MPDAVQIEARLENVLTTIYLLFNEGYYSLSQNQTLRKDLCLEAMRLCIMLVENISTNQPKVNALSCTLHSIRLFETENNAVEYFGE